MSVAQANGSGAGAALDDPTMSEVAKEPSMRELFEQGARIATHRKENVFQDLDKRTLSEEEEMVIKMRVDHQRKMYALFEKQVRLGFLALPSPRRGHLMHESPSR
jgi:hypothetical protein